jgi:hypothetical protein
LVCLSPEPLPATSAVGCILRSVLNCFLPLRTRLSFLASPVVTVSTSSPCSLGAAVLASGFGAGAGVGLGLGLLTIFLIGSVTFLTTS